MFKGLKDTNIRYKYKNIRYKYTKPSTRINSAFRVVTGFNPSNTDTTSQIVSAKNSFFFLFILLEQRHNPMMQQKEELYENTCHLLLQHPSMHVLSLSNKHGQGKCIDTLKFLQPSTDFLHPKQITMLIRYSN